MLEIKWVGNTGWHHRRTQNKLTLGRPKTVYRHTNKGIMCRWTEAVNGQVIERNRKTQEGGKTTEREEMKCDMRHTRVQFQNKTGNTRTGTGIITPALYFQC